jgi:GNAT superfamily N-acetyltransferase
MDCDEFRRGKAIHCRSARLFSARRSILAHFLNWPQIGVNEAMSTTKIDNHSILVIEADLGDAAHQRSVLDLLNAYSMDPMGDGKPLAAETRERLIPGLQEHPTTIVFLAYDENTAVGIAICFRGFSTFAAKPLINIHDLAVLPEHRGRGIGRELLTAVEAKARELGCCKLTLETQENNHRARQIYAKFGFAQATYQTAAGGSLFFSKPL